jgi:hypothetical protein
MSDQQTNQEAAQPSAELSVMMSAYIADGIKQFGTFVEELTEKLPMGAVVTANLTSFVQLLAVASFESGRTAAEAKEAMTSSLLAMQEYVDEIYARLEARKKAEQAPN